MKQAKRNPLYISPSRIRRTEQDLVGGFGRKEVIITMISIVVAIVVFLITNSAMNNIVIVPLAIAIMIIGGTVMMIYRDECDESMVDKIRFIVRFCFVEQKKYEKERKAVLFSDIRKFYEPEDE